MKIEIVMQGGLRRIVDVDLKATNGATIGVNVFNADGTLWVPPSAGSGQGTTITSWSLILDIPANVSTLAAFSGTGLYAITGAGTSAGRTITAAPGETTVANGNGVAGNPVIGLADVADAGGGSLQKTVFDAKGRRTGTSAATTSDLDEGSNLYFTNTRADARIAAYQATLAGLTNALDDAAAAAAGVPVGGQYRNGSVLMVRIA